MQIEELFRDITPKKKWILGILVFLTATLVFGLGYLLGGSTEHAPIIIEKRQ